VRAAAVAVAPAGSTPVGCGPFQAQSSAAIAEKDRAMRRFTVTVTTAADGTATAFTPRLSGKLMEIHYVKTDYVDGVDFAITSDVTGLSLWDQLNVNAGVVVRPRGPTHTTAGVAALYAAGGVAVNDNIALGGDRIKIMLTDGGATKVGTFHFLVD